MTTQQQIVAYFANSKRLLSINAIEQEAHLPRNTLADVIRGRKYRHLTPEQIERLIPVLKEIGFKLKND